jgi:hypothetical protein
MDRSTIAPAAKDGINIEDRALDTDPRAGTTDQMNRIDLNDPKADGRKVVEERLREAEGAAGAARSALTGMKKAELIAQAEAEGVEIADSDTVAQIVEKIEAARGGGE